MSEKRKPITLQAIFDAAWDAFLVENRPPAMNEEGCCCYLTPDGKKCAVGLCLPEGHEAQDVCTGLSTVVDYYPDLFDDQMRLMSYDDLTLFQSCLHDALAVMVPDGEGSTKAAWGITQENRRWIYWLVAKAFNLTPRTVR